MALYVIGDLHLSLTGEKPMDVFGERWANHTQRLREAFAQLTEDDVTVLAGDTSWGMSLEGALEDFRFLDALPGKKLLLKGNHDYWWGTAAKMKHFFAAQGFSTLDVLHNNCFLYGDYAICGTRGWFFEEEKGSAHDEKILNRELIRLETSLRLAGEREKICFLHYPPIYHGYRCQPILDLLHRYGVKQCWYGHLHAESHRLAVLGEFEGIDFRLVSADYVNFRPIPVKSSENSEKTKNNT